MAQLATVYRDQVALPPTVEELEFERAILHLDMDTFFVAVARLKDPTLVGKPVVVGGSPQGRGVVSSASYEARLYGVHAAMPMAEALRRCPQLVITNAGFQEYLHYSRQVRRILERTIPVVEAASVDEFYGDLTGTRRLHGPPAAHVAGILEAIRAETGLPCSGALATNKLVAKVAIRWAKPNGFAVIPPGQEAAAFAPLAVGALPGIGPVTQARLERAGIETLGQIAALSEAQRGVLFGNQGEGIVNRARGLSTSPVIPASDAQSVGHELTFARDIDSLEALTTILWELASRVGYKLRQEGLLARTLTLKLRRSNFQTYTRALTVPTGSNRDFDLARAGELLLSKVHQPGSAVRLLGLRASGLIAAYEQRLLFAAAEQDQQRAFYEALDAIRDRYGYGAIGSARTYQAARPVEEESLFALTSRQALQRLESRAVPMRKAS